jgi:sirohydrochlorin cobaltochelatase
MIKTKILLIGHGSRHRAGNDEIEQFADKWKAQNPQWQIEVCFIEFAAVLIDQGLDNAAQGADRVIVVPLILNAAGHVNNEIPYHIHQAHQRHPSVKFVYARHIGANSAIFSLLKRNLRKTLAKIAMPDPKSTGVILLARGSSDAIANGEIAKMARWLFEDSDHELVDIAFTGITYPRLETVVQRQTTLGMSQVAVLPYYLFTGTLIERIKLQVERLQQQYPQTAFALGSYFGFEEEIYQLLTERVVEACSDFENDDPLIVAVDGCHYKPLPEGDSHGHHHHDGHSHEHHHADEEK